MYSESPPPPSPQLVNYLNSRQRRKFSESTLSHHDHHQQSEFQLAANTNCRLNPDCCLIPDNDPLPYLIATKSVDSSEMSLKGQPTCLRRSRDILSQSPPHPTKVVSTSRQHRPVNRGRSQTSPATSSFLNHRIISQLIPKHKFCISSELLFAVLLLPVSLFLSTAVQVSALNLDLSNLSKLETNVSFVSLQFNSSFNTDLKRVVFDPNNSAIFVGAVNQIYKVYLNNISGDDREYLFIHQRITYGNFSDQCRMNETQGCGFDNQIKALLLYKRGFLFACGTGNNGVCETFNTSDIGQHRQYGSELEPVNLVGSRASVVAFFGPKSSSGTAPLYVGTEFDDRPKELVAPFVSKRKFAGAGFSYHFDTTIAKSFAKINPKYVDNFRVKFIYGFYHNGFAYFVTVQRSEPNSAVYETKLGRVCENDPRFDSYTEIPLTCHHESSVYDVASAATLSVNVTKKNHEYNLTTAADQTTKLFVAFDPYGSSSGGSALCSFNMNSIEKHFLEMTIDCFQSHSVTELLQSIHGERTSCTQFDDRINKTEIVCRSNSRNRFINGKTPLDANAILNIRNDSISSLGVIFFLHETNQSHTGPRPTPPKDNAIAFIGTEKSHILKVAQQDDSNKMKSIFVSKLNSGPILPDPALDLYTMTYYALTKRSLIRVPMDSCSVYSSCASCLKTGSCGWRDGQCYKMDFSNTRIDDTYCAPEVYSFSPKAGPVQGGTVLSFHGTNFPTLGPDAQNIPNSNMKITIGGFECNVIKIRPDFFQCQLEDIKNPAYDLTEGNISVTAYEFNISFSQNLFRINGTVVLKEKFKFRNASMKGIHPPYGPFIGGTTAMIVGDNLSIGSKHEVFLGDSPCKVLAKTNNYIVCRSGNFSSKNSQRSYPQEVILKIDSFSLIINSENGFLLESPPATFITRRSLNPTAAKLYFGTENSLLQFNENFEYRPDPKVFKVRNLKSIYSGNTEVYFFGEHFDSVHYPKLEIMFEKKSNKEKPWISINSTCYPKFPNNGNQLACKIPSLDDPRLGNLVSPNLETKAKLLLHLDGLIYPPFEKFGNLDIIYYPNPVFKPMTRQFEISSKDRVVVLNGDLLDTNIPFNITLDRMYPCLVHREIADMTKIKCSVDVNETQMAELYGKNMSLTVELGENQYKIGYAKFKNEAGLSSFQFGIVAIALALLVFILLFMCYFYRATMNRKEEDCKYTTVEYQSERTLESYFYDAFGDDDTLYKALLDRQLIIPAEQVDKEDKLIGHGEFGAVFMGSFDDQRVAIKQLRAMSEQNTSQIESNNNMMLFFKEADIMKDFKHPNVMSLLGLTMLDNIPSIIMPYMAHGDLKTFLKSNESIMLSNLITYGIQIASGMNYLASRKFVHRDLAARNCMIDATYTVKVADFGLTRQFQNNDYYKSNNGQMMPYRWMSLESLVNFHYTTESDVWSYGVLFWELTTRGEVPYGNDISPDYLIQHLKRGGRLSKPPYVPDLIFLIVQSCWLENPKERPTFAELEHKFREAYNLILESSIASYPVEKMQNIEYKVCQYDYRSPNLKQELNQEINKEFEINKRMMLQNGTIRLAKDEGLGGGADVSHGICNGGTSILASRQPPHDTNGNCDDLNAMETAFNEFPPPYTVYNSDFYSSPANVPSSSDNPISNQNNTFLQRQFS